MPQPNYQFQKRQRDLAKKARKEEKLQRKQAAKAARAATASGEQPAAAPEAAPEV